MKSVLAGIVLWSSSLIAPSASLAKDCVAGYVALNQTIENGLLRIKDQGAIHRLVSRTDLTSQQKAKLIFEQVFEARLAKLDPEVAAKIRRVVSNTRYVYGEKMSGFYMRRYDEIGISLPDSLKRTAVEYSILIHEAEHAIQELVVLGGANPSRSKFKAFVESLNYAKHTFEAERGAMIGEWHYVRALPREITDGLAVIVRNEPNLDQKSRALLLRWLESRDIDSVERFLQLEWQSGRYSQERLKAKQEIKVKEAAEELKDAVIVPALVASGITGSLTVLCHDLLASRTSSPENQTSCSKFLVGLKAQP